MKTRNDLPFWFEIDLAVDWNGLHMCSFSQFMLVTGRGKNIPRGKRDMKPGTRP